MVRERVSALVVEVHPAAFEALEAGVFLELLEFAVEVVLGEELDLAGFVALLALAGAEDREELPHGMVDHVLEFLLETRVSGVGVGGLDEVIDASEEVGAVAGAHEFLGGGGRFGAPVEWSAAIGVGLLALAGAEGIVAVFDLVGWQGGIPLSGLGALGKDGGECAQFPSL